jgi:hypothetical protein
MEFQSCSFIMGVTFNLRKLPLNSLFVRNFADREKLIHFSAGFIAGTKIEKICPY